MRGGGAKPRCVLVRGVPALWLSVRTSQIGSGWATIAAPRPPMCSPAGRRLVKIVAQVGGTLDQDGWIRLGVGDVFDAEAGGAGEGERHPTVAHPLR